MINLPLSLKSLETPMHKGTELSERVFWPLTHLSLHLSLYPKKPVRRGRTESPQTTYSAYANDVFFPSAENYCHLSPSISFCLPLSSRQAELAKVK